MNDELLFYKKWIPNYHYDTEQIEEAAEKFRVIRDKVAIYVLEDPSGETDSQNVFSWDIKKFFTD